MIKHNFKPISDIVDEVVTKHLPKGDVDVLSKQLDRIILCWPRCTNDLISQNVKPIRIIENELILETHSPVWANKMRYLQTRTLNRLNELGFAQIHSIRVKINPHLAEQV